MRTGQPIISRPVWYDRRPAGVIVGYTGFSVTPHTDTLRWTYTVPAGRKALVESVQMLIHRRTVATTAGTIYNYITYTPAGGAESPLLYIMLLLNTVGAREMLQLGHTVFLNPGDTLKGYTGDSSTGGTVDYINLVKLTEFDA